MQRKIIAAYFCIFALLIMMMSLSRHTSDEVRARPVGVAVSLWERLFSWKDWLFRAKETPSPVKTLAPISQKEKKEQLLLENQLLKNEIALLKKNQKEQKVLLQQLGEFASHAKDIRSSTVSEQTKFVESRLQTLQSRLQATPARVIVRSFDTWNQSLWINVGYKTGEELAFLEVPRVAVNSPVVVGSAIVGVIDFVGPYQSKVRLLSHKKLHPSVCVVRGGASDGFIVEKIEEVCEEIRLQNVERLSKEEKETLCLLLEKLKKSRDPLKKSNFLARGELVGSVSPSTRNSIVLIKGVGFIERSILSEGSYGVPLVQENDILVTTGLDGVFPPGFQTVIVKKVMEKKEGDYFYEIEGLPVVDLEELSLVFVLPPTKECDP